MELSGPEAGNQPTAGEGPTTEDEAPWEWGHYRGCTINCSNFKVNRTRGSAIFNGKYGQTGNPSKTWCSNQDCSGTIFTFSWLNSIISRKCIASSSFWKLRSIMMFDSYNAQSKSNFSYTFNGTSGRDRSQRCERNPLNANLWHQIYANWTPQTWEGVKWRTVECVKGWYPFWMTTWATMHFHSNL